MNMHFRYERWFLAAECRVLSLNATARYLGLTALLVAVSAQAETSLDTVLAEFQQHMGEITNAEVLYHLQQSPREAGAPSSQRVGEFIGRWLYANGKELIDFRADPEALSRLEQSDKAERLRIAVEQNVYFYDSVKDFTLYYNPAEQSARIVKGRKVRGWPPSEFLDRVTFPFGERIIDLIKGNKSSKLLSASTKPEEPVVIGFKHPYNDWVEYEISFLPAKGYRPVSTRISMHDGRRTMVYDITLVLRNGVWFPALVSYDHKSRDGKVNVHVDWMCTDIRVNDPSFDISRLQVKLRKGTTLIDSINNKSVLLESDQDIQALMQSPEER